jgi:cysteine synthase A
MTAPSPWLHEAIARIDADYQRSTDIHLILLQRLQTSLLQRNSP